VIQAPADTPVIGLERGQYHDSRPAEDARECRGRVPYGHNQSRKAEGVMLHMGSWCGRREKGGGSSCRRAGCRQEGTRIHLSGGGRGSMDMGITQDQMRNRREKRTIVRSNVQAECRPDKYLDYKDTVR